MSPSRTRVKVCGITSAADAAAAVRAGADAVGVVLAPSPRQVSVEAAEEILASVPPFVARVGVFVDAPAKDVAYAVQRLGLTAVQFHGAETPEHCAAANVPVIKAFRVPVATNGGDSRTNVGGITEVGARFDVDCVEPYQARVAAVLLDTYDPHSHGGTGKTFAWDSITELPGRAPIVLAGGLTPFNVARAIETVHPFAVDVSSGVESSPGVKDHALIEAFCVAVRSADAAASLEKGDAR